MSKDKFKNENEKELLSMRHKTDKALATFGPELVSKVWNLAFAELSKEVDKELLKPANEKSDFPKNKKLNVFDARIREKDGKATKADIKLLEKHGAKIKDLNLILDLIAIKIQLNIIFHLHKKGADLVEASDFIGNIDEKTNFEEDTNFLLRNNKHIN